MNKIFVPMVTSQILGFLCIKIVVAMLCHHALFDLTLGILIMNFVYMDSPLDKNNLLYFIEI